jgi:hypothetical protein
VDVQIDLPVELMEPESGGNLFIYPNGSFRFRPDNNMIGLHRINFTVKDGEHELEDELTLEVLNVNDPPVITGASTEGHRNFYVSGEEVVLEGSASDPDLRWGDSLDYRWSSHVSGPLGNGSTIVASLPPGDHRITLTVLDSLGQSDNFTLMITVSGSEEDRDPVMRTWLLYTLSGTISFMVSVLIGFLISLSILRKRRSKTETSGVGTAGEPDRMDMPPPRGPGPRREALPEKVENESLHELPPYVEGPEAGTSSVTPAKELAPGDGRDAVTGPAGGIRADGGDTDV